MLLDICPIKQMQSVAATTRTAKQHKLLHKLNTLPKNMHARAKSKVHISTYTCKPPWPPPEHANEYAHSLTTLVQHTIQVTTALPNVPTEYIRAVLLPPSFCIRIFLSSYVQKTSAAAVIVVVVSKGGMEGRRWLFASLLLPDVSFLCLNPKCSLSNCISLL